MGGTKLTALPTISSLSDDDLLLVVDDPSGLPISKKITLANLKLSASVGIPSIQTVAATASDAHTANDTWEDINSMSISITPTETAKLICQFTCMVTMASVNWEIYSFRFDLDESSQSYEWSNQKSANATSGQVFMFNMHTVFESVSAAAHTIKVQGKSSSNLDYTVTNRRLTIMVGK